jgi:cytochrome c oxidase subunit 4
MTQHVADLEQEELAHHPGPRTYVAVAVWLAVVTIAEVATFYIDMSPALLVPLLLAMAAVKFVMVVMWFMHLRFDSRIFRRLFVSGLVLALSVFAIMLGTFFARGGPAPGV